MRLLGFGDSITNGVGATRHYGYLRQVADEIGDVRFANVSVGGKTTADFVGEPATEAALRFLPDLVVVAFGVNDQKPGKRGRPAVTTEDYRENLLQIGLAFEVRANSRVLIIAPPFGLDYIAAAMYASEERGWSVANVSEGWTDSMWDGAHPNDLGHRHYADTVLACLVESQVAGNADRA